ncbi:MAG TPA: asparaginase [Candidatus Limnocylindrales bacterium]|nr:asparaginase [Candidatus Limnocylindrales bacterium]
MTTFTHKRVLILFTGGTVAGNVAKSYVSQEVKSRGDDFSAILEDSVEIIKKNWNTEISATVVELFNVDSSNMQPENWTALVEKIHETYDDYDSFIILHGTNTMGYTAAALSFAFENINKPVILTGAQVPLGFLGSDSTTNLVNALRLAVWGYHEVKGVIAVFGSKIISGSRVKKGTDFDYDPFKSFQTGTLGEIGRFMRINAKAMSAHVSYLSRKKPLAIQSRVLSVKKDFRTQNMASLTEFPGMSAHLFQSLVENNGIEAFILRAFGAGDPSAHLFPAFEYLRDKQIPIVVTTQAPNGLANFEVNETGQYLKMNELAIPAYDMSIESITTKLGWLLAQDRNADQIRNIMLEDLHGEINVENELI